jgi:pimeloyl-ACP methyl ester carboxylesterase
MRVVFVHGACVRDGAWWWQRAAAHLGRLGVASVAPVLPSCGEGAARAGVGGPGLDDDVAAVRAVLQNSAEPTVVVAHSYGGIVVAEAAADVEEVAHLVLISSYLPADAAAALTFAFPLAICLETTGLVVAELRGHDRAASAEIAVLLASAEAIRARGDRPTPPALAGRVETLRSAVGPGTADEPAAAAALARRLLTAV